GFNFRLDEPRAALGSAQLEHLDEDLEARHAVEAVLVDDVPGAIERLGAAGIDAAPVAASPRLVRLPPGTERDEVTRALRFG
ncbi:MAG: DegT/DnrJ/EryC1/StrS aminotransferase family, partial [Solirubrobacteraceae bacterium]|nr:DegT/DnrJ/EryC1/StrS aminotransferase family [Solirubrobacteraceae bacterium]